MQRALPPLNLFFAMIRCMLLVAGACSLAANRGMAQDPPATKLAWKYSPQMLQPIWQGSVIEGESVLFIKNPQTSEAKAAVLFPIQRILAVRNSASDVTYEAGRDYVWQAGSREITLPAGSRIVSRTSAELRRPAKSQRFALTHRDGDGEIFFGGRLEYADMQTCISYEHTGDEWKSGIPKFDAQSLPRTFDKLNRQRPLSILLIGDSISTGCNASAWADAAPYQPAYPELVRQHLEASYRAEVKLWNIAVGGTDTGWGLTMIDKIVEPHPDLVIIAFGMNDSAGRPVDDYQANISAMMSRVRERLPEAEFLLVATMVGNRDWIALKQERFSQYRDALKQLAKPGVAVADVTSVWARILELKQDWDQTGNGVNHPNDFGHRVYAQVLSTILIPAIKLSP